MSEQTSDITVQVPLEQLTELIARARQAQRPATPQIIQLSPDVLNALLTQAPAPGPVVIPTTGPVDQHGRRPSGCGPFSLFFVVVVCIGAILGLGYLRRNMTVRVLPSATPVSTSIVMAPQPPQENWPASTPFYQAPTSQSLASTEPTVVPTTTEVQPTSIPPTMEITHIGGRENTRAAPPTAESIEIQAVPESKLSNNNIGGKPNRRSAR